MKEYVGHLLSTLTAGLRLGTLWINTFSTDATPGKTEVSFEQWYHEVQCIKDHYSESIVWESIIRSLKEAAVDMAWYMGPTASVAHILWKLSVIFSTVVSFDVLMENFYKVTQSNNLLSPWGWKGLSIKIRLQCPGRMIDLEVQQHFMNYLFHEVQKHICDSIWYLYSTPQNLLLTVNGSHPQGREWVWGNPGQGEGQSHCDNWLRGRDDRIRAADSQAYGHLYQNWAGQQPF